MATSKFQFGRKPPALGSPGKSAVVVTAEPDPGEQAEAPEAPEVEAKESSSKIQPYMVCYRTADQVCSNCSNNENGHCTVLDMPIGDKDSCEAFADNGGGGGTEEMQPA
jgi:hypothetical protein